jgi:uncharacterized protein
MQALFETDPAVLVWWATEIECVSALARLEREGEIESDFVEPAHARLAGLSASWQEIEPSAQLRVTARRLLRVHALRAAHALQLAAAIVAAEGHPASLELVTLDDRLADAARREGFPLAATTA